MPEFHFFSPDDVPDEVKEALAMHQDTQRMGLETVSHDVQRLFRELDETQLGTLRFLIHTVAHNPEAGFYYEGVLATLYSIKANVCPACGKDHDKEMAEAVAREATDDPTRLRNPDGSVPDDISKKIAERMEEYGLRPADAERDDTDTGVICLGCGTRYVSLADRMIEDAGPAGCSGCVQKAKWG